MRALFILCKKKLCLVLVMKRLIRLRNRRSEVPHATQGHGRFFSQTENIVQYIICIYIYTYKHYTRFKRQKLFSLHTSATVCLSQGNMDTRSMTSHEIPKSLLAISATSSSTWTCVPQPINVTSLPSTNTSAFSNGNS